VFDTDDASEVARLACGDLPSCRAQRRYLAAGLSTSSSNDSDGSSSSSSGYGYGGGAIVVAGMEVGIRDEVARQQRSHLEQEVVGCSISFADSASFFQLSRDSLFCACKIGQLEQLFFFCVGLVNCSTFNPIFFIVH
jgi:hypothetical protein